MAERIVSPGVFIREKDQSFLAAGIANLGGAVIGPTFEGPALVPTLVSSYSDYSKRYGSKLGSSDFNSLTDHYTDEAVNSYFEGAGPSGPGLTVVRVLGNGGHIYSSSILLSFVSGSTAVSSSILLLPTVTGSLTFTSGVSSITFSSGSELGLATTGSNAASFVLVISGSSTTKYSASVSLDYSSTKNSNYITKVFGTSPNGKEPFYVAVDFKHENDRLNALTGTNAGVISGSIHTTSQSGSAFGEVNSSYGFLKSRTPWILNGNDIELFKFWTISDGSNTNRKFKIQIESIQYTTTAEDRYRFDVVVKDWDADTDNTPSEIERFSGVSCDPSDSRFIARIIGDKRYVFDSNDEIVEYGTFVNKSKYIYIEMKSASSTGDYVAKQSDYPWGFGSVLKPINSSTPPIKYIISNVINSTLNEKIHFGWEHSGSGDASTDNLEYLNPAVGSSNGISSALAENSSIFKLSLCSSNSESITTSFLVDRSKVNILKFSVPMQGGFDGIAPHVSKNIGSAIQNSNYYGFNLSGANTSGTKQYKAAINLLSNPDEIDVNLITIPGIIHNLHSTITNYLITKIEERADCFAIIDPIELPSGIATQAISTVVTSVDNLDSSYAAVYYPWVKMGLRYVPASVAVLGAYTQNDRLGAEWFAPAGLNRGGLASFGVTDVRKVLKNEDRDTLYEGRVNPIARFASQAATPQVVVFGQKTLQLKASALDRVNVRRLIINLKKFIASSSKFLVFEQNNSSTRQRFINMVNPYMENIQQRSGLTAFKVVMDDSNNTSEVIDRNQLVGQIYIQPTRTAEFIILDFAVLPTGAAFPTE